MADDDLKAHEVEYLSTTNATLCANDAPIVIITIRPELSRSATCLLLLAVLGLTGCSSKVEAERQKTTGPSTEQAQSVVTERSRTPDRIADRRRRCTSVSTIAP